MNFFFFTDLERNINEMVITIVNTISSNALEYFSPLISLGLGITFSWFGLMVLLGNSQAPAMDFVKKVITTAIVVSIAGVGGLYQRELMHSVLDLPSELASALIDGSQPGVNVLDLAAQKTLDKTAEIFDLVGVTPSSWLNAIVAVVFFVSALFLIGSTAVYFIISKVVVSVLVGLGFIFIMAFLWEPIRNFFSAWVNQIVHYALMLVVSALFFSFLMGMYDRFISAFTVGESNLIYSAFAIAAFSYIGYRLLNEIPTLCRALSNGVSINGLTKSSASAGKGGEGNSKPSSNSSGSSSDSGGKPASSIPTSPAALASAPFRGKS